MLGISPHAVVISYPGEHQRLLIDLLSAPDRTATARRMLQSGQAQQLVSWAKGESRIACAQAFASVADAGVRDQVRSLLRRKDVQPERQPLLWLFDVAAHLHQSCRDKGLSFDLPPFARPIQVTHPALEFTGSGATGISPRSLRIPAMTQLAMLTDDVLNRDTIIQMYRNPGGGANLGLERDLAQTRVLVGQAINSCVPFSYRGLPSRWAVFAAAAMVYNLEPKLIAAVVLTEQRDQSQNEDAADYTAATSLLQHNSSVGLGQVLITTARKCDLFSELLPVDFRKRLSHNQIALLLTSDEFNIFAVAKYIRRVANLGARASPQKLRHTLKRLPGLDLKAYRKNSRDWPAANIVALGGEYTTKPWDDKVFYIWGSDIEATYSHLVGREPGGNSNSARRSSR